MRKYKGGRRGKSKRCWSGGAAPLNDTSMLAPGNQNLAQGRQYLTEHANQHGGAAVSLASAAPVGDTGMLDDSLRATARIGVLDQSMQAIQGMKDQSGGSRRRRKMYGGAAVSLASAAPVGDTGMLDDSLRATARIGVLDQSMQAIQGMKDQAGGSRRRRKMHGGDITTDQLGATQMTAQATQQLTEPIKQLGASGPNAVQVAQVAGQIVVQAVNAATQVATQAVIQGAQAAVEKAAKTAAPPTARGGGVTPAVLNNPMSSIPRSQRGGKKKEQLGGLAPPMPPPTPLTNPSDAVVAAAQATKAAMSAAMSAAVARGGGRKKQKTVRSRSGRKKQKGVRSRSRSSRKRHKTMWGCGDFNSISTDVAVPILQQQLMLQRADAAAYAKRQDLEGLQFQISRAFAKQDADRMALGLPAKEAALALTASAADEQRRILEDLRTTTPPGPPSPALWDAIHELDKAEHKYSTTLGSTTAMNAARKTLKDVAAAERAKFIIAQRGGKRSGKRSGKHFTHKNIMKAINKLMKKHRGGAHSLSNAADYGSPGMLLSPGAEARALAGMNPEWKLATDPTSFAPKM